MPTNKPPRSALPSEAIERRILLIRGHKVMLDRDLAALYEVKPIALRQAVKRNRNRFPPDFVIQLSQEEATALVSQNVIPSRRSFGGFLPYAFTEQGVAMLSSVLRSERAAMVNIAIMRTFVRLRQILATHKQLADRLAELEKKYDQRFKVVFDVLQQLTQPPEPPKKPMGFIPPARGEKYVKAFGPACPDYSFSAPLDLKRVAGGLTRRWLRGSTSGGDRSAHSAN